MNKYSQVVFDTMQVRKTKEQKTRFIDLVTNICHEKSLPVQVQESKSVVTNRNIVVGNVNSADVICTAHYDTCPVLPFPNFLTPKNIVFYIIYQMLLCAVMLALAYVVNYVIAIIVPYPLLGSILGLAFLLLLLYLLMFGPANKNTANDNTSGVVTLLEIMDKLTAEQWQHTCLVFFDNEEIGLVGSSAFKRYYGNRLDDKLVVNYDCVSDGDHIMVIRSKCAITRHQLAINDSFGEVEDKNIIITNSSNTLYPSDQMRFKCSIGVASFKKNRLLGYYIDKIHTRHDTAWDERNISYLVDSSIQLIDILSLSE